VGYPPNLRELDSERANSLRFSRLGLVISQNATLPVSFSTNYCIIKRRAPRWRPHSSPSLSGFDQDVARGDTAIVQG
jgi:hypothetical protein